MAEKQAVDMKRNLDGTRSSRDQAILRQLGSMTLVLHKLWALFPMNNERYPVRV